MLSVEAAEPIVRKIIGELLDQYFSYHEPGTDAFTNVWLQDFLRFAVNNFNMRGFASYQVEK